MKKYLLGFASSALLLVSTNSLAAEHPIGQAFEKNSMEIGAVYLQPVIMAPTLPAFPQHPDVHLETDVHALKGNPNGFGVGEWIPYLKVAYTLTKVNNKCHTKPGKDYGTRCAITLDENGQPLWQATGSLMPMVASDGPHYGANVQLHGIGKYKLTFNYEPPSENGFFHHKDKATGVNPWWKPFSLSWYFTFVGTGKKGGY